MTQRANNRGRNAALDDKKARAAGRQQNDPVRAALGDRFDEKPTRGKTGGATGKAGKASRRTSVGMKGAGGGGNAMDSDHAAPMDTPPSKRRARKR
ncbi:MAG TPA: hypothetical protein VF669_05695 [Tepidisphaeraceae bacterium]|jgi:hypothetical protein